MILADKIINLRKKNGWSQEELAHKLGVSRQSISKYEGAQACLLYTSPSPRDGLLSRMPSSA